MKQEEPLLEIRASVGLEEEIDVELNGDADYILPCLNSLFRVCATCMDMPVDELLSTLADCIKDEDISEEAQVMNISIDEGAIEDALRRYRGGAEP